MSDSTASEQDQHSSAESSAAAEGARSGGRRRPSAARRLGRGVMEIIFVLVLALVITTALRAFVVQMFIIPSSSMENTLQVHDRVMVSRMSTPARGDIVVFKDPGGWLGPVPERSQTRKTLEFIGVLPDSSQQYLVKRLIGKPGDRVKCCTAQGRLTVNGHELDESTYLKKNGSEMVAPAAVPFEVIVPAGRIFVMGDNRSNSQDSRCHLADLSPDGGPPGAVAFVPEDDIIGPAVAIVAPTDRMQRLRTPAVFSGVPGPAAPAPARATIIPEGVACQ